MLLRLRKDEFLELQRESLTLSFDNPDCKGMTIASPRQLSPSVSCKDRIHLIKRLPCWPNPYKLNNKTSRVVFLIISARYGMPREITFYAMQIMAQKVLLNW